MSDPISGLQGKPDPSGLATPTPSVTVTPPPPVREVQYTQGQSPQEMLSSSTSFSPPPPEPFIPPASGSQLEGGMSGPMAPPPELAGQPAFSLSLPGAINPAATEAAPLIAPTQTGNQQALQIVGPGVQRGIEGLRFERGERYTGAMDPAAVGYQRTWEPPDIDASISNFGSQMGVLRESYRAQTAQRQNESERAWLERNMAAIENMSKPPGSATGNSMEWVNQMLGISEDGNRQYVGAAVFDKSKGEWRGSAIGGVLYSLGILQNSAMGGLMDVTNIFRNVDKGLKAAYENFTPPWARSGTDNALRTLGNLFPILPLLRKLPSTGKYDDGKSNFVEALRGAQYSFSDKAGKGFGIDFNTGFKLSTDIKDYTGNPGGGFSGPAFINPKSGKGIDINPGVIAGIGLDFVFGAKVDRLATAAAKRLGIRLPGAAQAAATAQAPAPTPPTPRTSVFQPTQLNIPFMSGPVKAGKQAAPQVPAALKAAKVPKPPAPPKGDVQAVLPIAAMMDEFGVADRLINPKA